MSEINFNSKKTNKQIKRYVLKCAYVRDMENAALEIARGRHGERPKLWHILYN